MWEDYTVLGGTYRENLLNTPGNPTVPQGHPARNYRYSVLKEKYADENGDIIIDRRKEQKISESVTRSVPEADKLAIKEKPSVSTVEVKV
jgi:hypothetical protein